MVPREMLSGPHAPPSCPPHQSSGSHLRPIFKQMEIFKIRHHTPPPPQTQWRLPALANEARALGVGSVDVKDGSAAWKPRNRPQAGWAPEGWAQKELFSAVPRASAPRGPASPFMSRPGWLVKAVLYLLQSPLQVTVAIALGGLPWASLPAFLSTQPLSPGRGPHMPGSPEPTYSSHSWPPLELVGTLQQPPGSTAGRW